MSGDEAIALFMSLGFAALAWVAWLVVVLAAARRCWTRARVPLLVVPPLCAALLFAILRRYSSEDVRDAPEYLLLYTAMGMAWLGIAAWLLTQIGLSFRDDVVERGNPAAAWAISGALAGVTLCYAGGNIGNGPGWWVVVFCAALATAVLLLLWLLLDQATRIADTVTIDRDPAAGLRLAGFFVAVGLVLGRAVAGDWTSAESTVLDFGLLAWPALGIWGAAALLEPQLRPTPERLRPPVVEYGVLPAGLYLGLAAAALAWAGWWS
jgi:uncharacterized membrane protein YjfL (UPF0719 family)